MKRHAEEDAATAAAEVATPSTSVIEDVGVYHTSCGYCKSGTESLEARGMTATTLTAEHYQSLLDRAWRRSGAWLYRPNPGSSCCPHYSIRVDANAFAPTKKLRKTLARLHRFAAGEWPAATHATEDAKDRRPGAKATKSTKAMRDHDIALGIWTDHVQGVLQAWCAREGVDYEATIGGRPEAHMRWAPAHVVHGYLARLQLRADRDQGGEDLVPTSLRILSSPLGFKLARHHGKTPEVVADHLAALMREGTAGEGASPLEDVFHDKGYVNLAVRVAARASDPHDEGPGGSHSLKAAPADADANANANANGRMRGQKRGRGRGREHSVPRAKPRAISIEMVPSTFLEEEFDLYVKYQREVHKDTAASHDPSMYTRFLVDSPIPQGYGPPGWGGARGGARDANGAGRPRVRGQADAGNGGAGAEASTDEDLAFPCAIPPFQGYGTFHQQYRIDGKLVAVGVVDVLPRCLSSKYFFWDPDYAFLEFGKISALAEIAFVRNANAHDAVDLRYYYQGYYIHTCPKMSYKAQYKPCQLLCPTTLRWIHFDRSMQDRMEASGGKLLSLCCPVCSGDEGDEGDEGVGERERERGAKEQLFRGESATSKALVSSDTLKDVTVQIYGTRLRLEALLRNLQGQDEMKTCIVERAAEWMASCGDVSHQMLYHLA